MKDLYYMPPLQYATNLDIPSLTYASAYSAARRDDRLKQARPIVPDGGSPAKLAVGLLLGRRQIGPPLVGRRRGTIVARVVVPAGLGVADRHHGRVEAFAYQFGPCVYEKDDGSDIM